MICSKQNLEHFEIKLKHLKFDQKITTKQFLSNFRAKMVFSTQEFEKAIS